MDRRQFIFCTTMGANTASLLASQNAEAADQPAWVGPVSQRVMLAFDGLDYPSWDQSRQVPGFMAFFQTGSPDGNVPYTITMSLYVNDIPVPAKPGNQYNPYRSVALNGAATDWAVVHRRFATSTLFLPYQALVLPRDQPGLNFRLLFRVIDSSGTHLASLDKSISFAAGVEPDQTLVQRFVAPAAGPPGSPPPPPMTLFSANLQTGKIELPRF